MKQIRVIYFLFIGITFLTGCKKDPPPPTQNNNAPVVQNGNLTFNDADGMCYSLLTRGYADNSSPAYLEYKLGTAWFGSSFASKKEAGDVVLNTYHIPYDGLMKYYYLIDNGIFTGNIAEWKVAGNATNGITGFTYIDDSPFPSGGNFNVPALIDIHKDITIPIEPVSNVLGVMYSVEGSKGDKDKFIPDGASSVTFTAAELAGVAYENEEISFSIMPVAATPATINGKKYYFVKQFQHYRSSQTF